MSYKFPSLRTLGIHHVSSIVAHAQKDIDFYTSVMGLRLLKRTLNYDDSSTYHFYYGNQDGSTNLMTTFPWNDAAKGVVGAGQVGTITFAVNHNTLTFWKERLSTFMIDSKYIERFNKQRLSFNDPSGLRLELIEREGLPQNKHSFNNVSEPMTLSGIDQATLYSRVPHTTLSLLIDVLGYQIINEDEDYYLLKIHDRLGGTLLLNKKTHNPSRQGVGTVHHIALKVNTQDIEAYRDFLIHKGYRVTDVKDRKYFKSIYFRDKGGIIFELATKGPGVTVDERVEDLGNKLIIPEHFKPIEDEIVATMMPITVREVSTLSGYGYRNKDEFNILRERETLKKRLLILKKLEKERPLDDVEKKELEEIRSNLLK